MIDRKLTPESIEDIRALGPINDLRVLPIALSMDPPDGVDVEQICIDLIGHPDAWVRGNAAVGLGHLARVLRRLDHDGRIKRDLEALLHDEEPIVSGRAADAISDIRNYLGWSFRDTEPKPNPRVPRVISTSACYRVYLLIDEESNVLVERSVPADDDFGPDPRGLAHDSDWRLPGFSLTEPLSGSAQAIEEAWAMRYPKVWLNESNRFQEVAVVRMNVTGESKAHRYRDWVELRCRAYLLTERTDNPYNPNDGSEHRWLTSEEFMTGGLVGAFDRYVLALFDAYFAEETGKVFF